MYSDYEYKIAIICDWLIDFGWAELVISHLLEAFPEADIYTSVCYMDHPMLEWRRVYTSWLQKVPILNRRHKLAGVLRPWAFRSFDLSGYDLIICSSSAESKQVACGKWNHARHVDDRRHPAYNHVEQDFSTLAIASARNDRDPKIWTLNLKTWTRKPKVFVYCHTPTRYYWSHAKEYEDMMEFGWMNPLVKTIFRLVRRWMQKVDYEAAQKVDFFIANSENTRERIKKYYGRDSTVIYPGVSLPDPLLKQRELSDSPFPSEKELGSEAYYLSIGRCIPYKRFDLLVDTFNANGKSLILCTATDTPTFRTLQLRSRSNIKWKFRVSNEEKDRLLSHARAFLFPPEEDFGLVPIEAMISGIPVIAYGKWWALETIEDGKTGIFFSRQTPLSLDEALERFEKMTFDPEMIIGHAKKFSKENFQKNILKFIKEYVN